MSCFVPTTLMSLHRDVDEDEFGDPIDDNVVITSSDLPAVITEKSQRTFLPLEQRLGVVERYVIRLRPGVDVQEGDRLQDQNYPDNWYQVQEVVAVPLVVGVPDIRVTCIKVGAASRKIPSQRVH